MSQKRVAYVTGGMGGIGTAICQRLHKEGYTVIAGCGPTRDFGKQEPVGWRVSLVVHTLAGRVGHPQVDVALVGVPGQVDLDVVLGAALDVQGQDLGVERGARIGRGVAGARVIDLGESLRGGITHRLGRARIVDDRLEAIVGELGLAEPVGDVGELTRGAYKRHPTLKDGVIIYANATILGGQTVIGERSGCFSNPARRQPRPNWAWLTMSSSDPKLAKAASSRNWAR